MINLSSEPAPFLGDPFSQKLPDPRAFDGKTRMYSWFAFEDLNLGRHLKRCTVSDLSNTKLNIFCKTEPALADNRGRIYQLLIEDQRDIEFLSQNLEFGMNVIWDELGLFIWNWFSDIVIMADEHYFAQKVFGESIAKIFDKSVSIFNNGQEIYRDEKTYVELLEHYTGNRDNRIKGRACDRKSS